MSMGMSYGITAETGNNIQTDGLVFYVDAAYKKSYPGSGTSLSDIAGGVTGTMDGAVITDDALSLDGSNDFVDMGNILHFTGTEPWTVQSWCYFDDAKQWQSLCGDRKGSGNYNGWGIYAMGGSSWSSVQKTALNIKRSGGNEIKCHGDATVPTTTWVNKTVSYNGNEDVSGVKMYQNTVEETVSSLTNTLSGWDAVTDDWYIGSRAGGADWFKGDIALILVYDRELTANHILQNYNASKERFGL